MRAPVTGATGFVGGRAGPREGGVGRVVYLGGLGERPKSQHLRSRHETGRILGAEGPPLTYLRAAMVVDAGSESYETLRHLVERLPLMIAPAWLSTSTQPIDVDDVVAYAVLSPGLSSRWIGLVTPVDAGVARPLVEGLSTETVVKDPSGASLFDVVPIGVDAALRKAIAEEDGALAAVP